MKNRILLVEDERDLGNVVKQYLEIMDFDVEWSLNGKTAYATYAAAPANFDLLVIDVQLPGMNGFDLAGKIQQHNTDTPYLFLTARGEKKDRINGLSIGADDYITKPFDIDELVLRIKNIIKRRKPGKAITSNETTTAIDAITFGDIIFQQHLLKIKVGNRPSASLTVREAELLKFLYHHRNSILKREDILVQLWGENDYFIGRSLDVFISRLRKQLSASEKVSIDNVYSVGFIFTVKE